MSEIFHFCPTVGEDGDFLAEGAVFNCRVHMVKCLAKANHKSVGRGAENYYKVLKSLRKECDPYKTSELNA